MEETAKCHCLLVYDGWGEAYKFPANSAAEAYTSRDLYP
jgi:hypothetical protein